LLFTLISYGHFEGKKASKIVLTSPVSNETLPKIEKVLKNVIFKSSIKKV